MSKQCPKCGKDKDFFTYYNSVEGIGLHLICTDCMNQILKKFQKIN